MGLVTVPLPRPLVPVLLVRRVNRFAAEVRLGKGGRLIYAHLPNSGRMEELLRPGAEGLVHMRDPAPGRTRGTLLLVRHRRQWVGVDAHLPNRLFEAALAEGGLEPFTHVRRWRREVPYGPGRIDFALDDGGGSWLVEVKSCNKVHRGIALFPDAPTTRGARHLGTLAGAARKGLRAAVVWFVQRRDASALRPDRTADPGFAEAAVEAVEAGVELYAYICRVDPRRIAVLGRIPVDVGGERARSVPLGGGPAAARPTRTSQAPANRL